MLLFQLDFYKSWKRKSESWKGFLGCALPRTPPKSHPTVQAGLQKLQKVFPKSTQPAEIHRKACENSTHEMTDNAAKNGRKNILLHDVTPSIFCCEVEHK